MAEVDTTAVQPTENVNTNTEAPATPAEATAEQVAKYLGTSVETLEKFTKFTEANGKFDSAFAKLKKDISAPERQEEKDVEPQVERTARPQTEQPAQPNPTPQTEQPAQPNPTPQMAEGFISPQAFATKQYFLALSKEKDFGPIAKDIESGAVMKEMADFGIQVTDDAGNYNDAQIRKFLALKAKTVPAQASEPVEPTNTPLVEYTTFDGDIQSLADAQKIISESLDGINKGAAPHAKYEEAKKFLAREMGMTVAEKGGK